MKWNDLNVLPINPENLKKSFNKKSIFSNEKTFNTNMNDNFVISQYYNEIIAPYTYNSHYQNGDYIVVQERGHTGLIPNNPPSTFLFQYTN